MNSQVPELATRDLASPKVLKDVTHIAIPVTKAENENPKFSIPKNIRTLIDKSTSISLEDELTKSGEKFAAKAGEIWEVPLAIKDSKLNRIYFVGVGTGDENDLRKAGSSIGRRVKGEAAKSLITLPNK